MSVYVSATIWLSNSDKTLTSVGKVTGRWTYEDRTYKFKPKTFKAVFEADDGRIIITKAIWEILFDNEDFEPLSDDECTTVQAD